MQQKSTKHFVSFTPILFLIFAKTHDKEIKKKANQTYKICYIRTTYKPKYIPLHIKTVLKDCNKENHKAWKTFFLTKK